MAAKAPSVDPRLVRLAQLSALQQQIQDQRERIALVLLSEGVGQVAVVRAMGHVGKHCPVTDRRHGARKRRRLEPRINGRLVTVPRRDA